MIGIYLWIGLSIGNIYLSARALRGSIRERFRLGIGAGVVLVAVATSMTVLGLKMYFPGKDGPSTWLGSALLALMATMPAVSFPVLFVAYRRTIDVPAAEEERAGRPFRAWLPVGVVNGILVVIGLGVAAMLASDP